MDTDKVEVQVVNTFFMVIQLVVDGESAATVTSLYNIDGFSKC